MLSEELDGEVLCIDEQTGTYFSMAGTATASWNLLVAGTSAGEVAGVASSAHPGVEGVADDVDAFVSKLLEVGLLEARPDDTYEGGPSVDWGSNWTAPDVGVHADMQDILLFDPIHQVDYDKGWPHRSDD